ncbi:MAG: bifunctional phosphoribosylaminoimidazolecarboxamide formyltransferase/IMP cyclohydrolase [Candidatus Omnitrophota bacterium]
MEIKRALISVSDKTGLRELVEVLNKYGVEIMSTGGTAEEIASYGVTVREVSSYTDFPEMLDGRVKTLHPKIHAGFLALRNNKKHMKCLEENAIFPIDMLVVNLYPFEKTIAKPNVSFEEAIENIDIGGPAMMRSAAKNFKSVAVVSSITQYGMIIEELENSDGNINKGILENLAKEVFKKTSYYDAIIADYLAGKRGQEENDGFPNIMKMRMNKIKELRYGENPHQKAAFYKDLSSKAQGIADAEQLQGKELSFNNILDLSAAYEMVTNFSQPAVSIVKHNNPCGIAVADNLQKAFIDAVDCDRLSAFGGIMAFNRSIDGKMAQIILKESDFVECIIASEYDVEAKEIFSVKKNLRLLKLPLIKSVLKNDKDFKKVSGGMLVQDSDVKDTKRADMQVVTEAQPSEELWNALMFGWKVVKYVKSNAIVLCKGTKTVGIGAGQMSRVDSVIIAMRKAGARTKEAILASDAFFPKIDSIEEAYKAGIAAIIQPGGSIRDNEVIDACNKFNLPMVFTGVRHFRH